ncbi:acyl-CoA dehydrogenase family protein [Nocardioides daejeonensis]|uniref:acyl-CoA dehydrogenase family protein n=1 Tax=Nocardioides daejeonensis TaxID=1046556 RepID=UPI000D74A598|nr:acyl-CoA dehydrogenase family protein [Nocardioides daejeonensis]
MRATFTQEQSDIAKTVRAMADGGVVSTRAALEHGWQPPGCDEVLLRDFSVLGVPEGAGGVGSSLIDLLVAVEALGQCLAPSAFVAHAAALQLAVGAGADLTSALAGDQRWVPAVDEPGVAGWLGLAGTADSPVTKTLVPYASGADRVVALGRDGVTIGEATELRERVSFDPSQPLADVLPSAGTALPEGRGAQRATLVASAELCGVAQGAIALAGGHARTREQFGRVIGSFQGVAFQLAEAVALAKAGWDLTLHAAWAVENDKDEAEMQVHAAKAAAGKAAVFAAERCIQVHGGMGITMEADPHLYLRRAMVLDNWLGSSAWHRRRAGELRIASRR